ncbi:MAG: MMPL family transporter [Deltaproteobacteria bacterium]|nr:MMPL family transporter [Deltaproteobacteria bacterium]
MENQSLIAVAYERGLLRWLRFVVAHPRTIIALVILTTVGAAWYTATHLRMNSNTQELVRQDAPFRQRYEEFGKAFPHYESSTLVVLTAADHGTASKAAERLATALRARPDLITNIYSPDEGSFFRDRALLYMDIDELETAVSRMAEVQPILATLARDPSLRGIHDEVSAAMDLVERGDDPGPGFGRLSDRLSEIIEGHIAGDDDAPSWQETLLGREQEGDVHHVVAVQGNQDFDAKISSELLIQEIRAIATELDLTPEKGVVVRLTGMVPLAYEELLSLRSSVGVAGLLAACMLAAILVLGTRSLRVIVATLATVVVGIVWTSAFAMAAVGEFNTFSAAFSVLLIGLGVDFAIHICLRALEALDEGLDVKASLLSTGGTVGRAVSLCALTSAIGFLAYVPTEYTGLAQLGIITGGGMFLTLIASLTITPALLVATGTPTGRPSGMLIPDWGISLMVRHARSGAVVALLAALVATAIASRMTFDFSTLGIRDPESESMVTLSEIREAGILTDYSVTLMARDLEAAHALTDRLEALDLVAEVRDPQSYLPDQQEEKLELLADAQLLLGPALDIQDSMPPPSRAERVALLRELRDRARVIAGESPDPAISEASSRLAAALGALLVRPEPALEALALEELVVADFDEHLDWLRRALAAEATTLADLPPALERRLISPDGHVLVTALPTHDISNVRALNRFLDAISSVAPGATGRPVVESGIGKIVVRSFHQAIAIATIAILLVVLLALRDPVETLLVLTPIAMAAVFTTATAVLIDMPFNMANVMAIPLVLGLGVDNGIHLVLRYREEGCIDSLLHSSTARAIVLSGLTTLAAFGALSISSHRGISSMGMLLTIAIFYLMFCTLVVLPALLAWRSGERLQAATP